MQTEKLRELAARYAGSAGADHTDAAYGRQWARFQAFCVARELELDPADPEPILMFLTSRAVEDGVGASTLVQTLSALRHHYRRQWGEETAAFSRDVAAAVRNLQRDYGRPVVQAAPLRAQHLAAIVEVMEGNKTRQWLRDRALLLLAWATAYRRSEVTRLRWRETMIGDGFARVFLAGSKGDQARRGIWTSVAGGANARTCPVCALRTWRESIEELRLVWLFPRMAHHSIVDEPISGSAVSAAVKRYVPMIGLDPGQYSSHSLRAGWVTDMLASGVSEAVVMSHTRHRSRDMMAVYYRGDDSALGDSTRRVGL